MNNSTIRLLFATGALVALLNGVAGVAAAQQGALAGRVSDRATELPLPAAQVIVRGTVLRAQTGSDGRYRIERVAPGEYQVEVRRLGYASSSQPANVTAGDTVQVDFALQAAAIGLDEVVVTPTGEQAKREIGNTIAKIDAAKVVQEAPVTDIADLLSGRASSVQVLQESGTVGTGTRVRIRGLNSLSLNNEPLYYVDGIRVERGSGLDFNVGGQDVARINDFNPEEIESIEVVKGPSAATLYGTEAASGVIRIATKRGQAGRPRWSVYSEAGLIVDPNQYPTNYTSFGHSLSTGAVRQCRLTDANPVPPATPVCAIDSLSSFNVLMNPTTTPYSTGHRQQYGAQVGGGGQDVQYFFASEYERETGVLHLNAAEQARIAAERGTTNIPHDQIDPNALTKVNLRGNITAALGSKARLTVSSGVVTSTTRLPQNDNNVVGLLGSGLFGKGYQTTASPPVTGGNPEGTEWGFFLPGEVFGRTVSQDVNRFTNSAEVNWLPKSYLTFHGTVGLDYTGRIDRVIQLLDQGPAFAIRRQGAVGQDRTSIYQYTVDVGGTGVATLSPTIRSKTSAGIQYYKRLFADNQAFAQQLSPGGRTLTSGAVPSVAEATTQTITLGSYVEQQFGWRDRLFVTGALRVDENSAFGRDARTAAYPKGSVSWLISDEPFFHTGKVLNSLRLRGAIGGSGLQPADTAAIKFYTPVQSAISGADLPAVTLSNLGNRNLKPERSTEIELGADAGLLNNRVSMELTYYHKKTTDALIERRIAPSLGATQSRFENIGQVVNKGFEALVNARVLDRPDLQWDVTLSGSTNSNRIVTLGPGVPPIRGTAISEIPGYPLFAWWVIPIKSFADANGDGILEANEVVVGDTAEFLGYSTPRYEAALNTGISLFNNRIRIGGQLDYRGGYLVRNRTEFFRCTSSAASNCRAINDPTAPLEDQAAAVAALTGGTKGPAFRTEAGYLEPGWFVKFREASVTFNAPVQWASAIGGDRLSLTITARNLGTITDYKGIDPEVNGNGTSDTPIDFLTQPPVRYWTFRINLGF